MVLVLFQVGLPGVALVLTYGQLISQIYVEEFTLQFLNMYGSEFVVRLSLGNTSEYKCIVNHNYFQLLYMIPIIVIAVTFINILCMS
jgi:hypothetical protein